MRQTKTNIETADAEMGDRPDALRAQIEGPTVGVDRILETAQEMIKEFIFNGVFAKAPERRPAGSFDDAFTVLRATP